MNVHKQLPSKLKKKKIVSYNNYRKLMKRKDFSGFCSKSGLFPRLAHCREKFINNFLSAVLNAKFKGWVKCIEGDDGYSSDGPSSLVSLANHTSK